MIVSNNGTPAFAPEGPHRNDGCAGIKLGYGTFGGISNVRFEDNRIEYAGIAIKITSYLGMGGRLTNVSFDNTSIVKTGIAVNVDMRIVPPLVPGGGARGKSTDPTLLSTLDGLTIDNLHALESIGCYSNVSKGAYCGGAGCLIGSHLAALRHIRLRNVSISSADGQTVGWNCANASTSSDTVLPAACRPAGMNFTCSET